MIYDLARTERQHIAIQKSQAPTGNRRNCMHCKTPRSQIGGRLLPRPGSRRRDWICAGCAADRAVAA